MEVRYSERISGKGLFSTKQYKKDMLIFTLDGEILDRPTKYSIHIGNNLHIVDKYGIFINHCFDPTIKIDGKRVVATRDIGENEELHFNYNDTEKRMAFPFHDGDILVNGDENNNI